MSTLTENQKAYIVKLLAAYETPSAVAVRFREELGVEVDRSQVIRYDSTKPCFEAGERWRSVFEAARKAYLETIETIPIAHKAYRLNELQRNYDKAQATGNVVLANATLRQAAEEADGVVERQQRPGWNRELDEMSSDERRIAATELIRKALESKGLTLTPRNTVEA